MRTQGNAMRGGAAGGDVRVGKIVFNPQPRVVPPSPTRIRALTPEQQQEQEEARKKISPTRRKVEQKHDYDRRSRQPATLSQEKIEQVITLYTAGHSASAVSKAVGISKTTTLRYLREGGVKIRGSRKRAVATEEIVKAYRRGLSLRELGQLYGMSNTTVRNRLLEADEPIRGKGDWRAQRRAENAVGARGEDD